MAKGKHSAALFEVIARDKPLTQQPRPRIFQGLSAWLRPQVRPAPPTPILRTADDQAAHRPASSLTSGPAPVTVRPPALEHLPLPPSSTDEAPLLHVDNLRREIRLRLTYRSAAIAATALLTVVAMAYVIGRKLAPLPAGAQAEAAMGTAVIRQGPPQPAVLHLERSGGAASVPAPATGAAGGTAMTLRPPATQPVPNPGRVVRNINENYVIIQSYPASERQWAQEAQELLLRNGISCTIEEKVSGYMHYAVVGTVGFTQTRNNPQLDQYLARIRQISDEHIARRGRASFKAFEPTLKKWDR